MTVGELAPSRWPHSIHPNSSVHTTCNVQRATCNMQHTTGNCSTPRVPETPEETHRVSLRYACLARIAGEYFELCRALSLSSSASVSISALNISYGPDAVMPGG
jgi:hypothetical protein